VSCPKALEDDILPDGEKTLFDWTKEGRVDKLKVGNVCQVRKIFLYLCRYVNKKKGAVFFPPRGLS
jgi:hypothetical protein